MASAELENEDADEYYSRMMQAAQEPSTISAQPPTSVSDEHVFSPSVVVESAQTSVQYQPPPAKDFEKLAKINATINRMTVRQVREELGTLGRDTRGNKATLVKRLKSYYRLQRLQALNRAPKKNVFNSHYDYLLVLDFECTCEDKVYEFNHEIIEFPVVMVCTKQMRIVDEFHAYVKPLINAQLNDFCSRLTGISQAQVDAARPFPGVFDDFRAWMSERNLTDGGYRFAFVTDGPWDLGKFFQMQCYNSGYDTVPHDFRYWINVRRAFSNLMSKNGPNRVQEWKNLAGMLEALGMTFEGREHSGIDDARNIARIVIRMLQERRELRVNERLLRRDVAERKLEKRRNDPNNKSRISHDISSGIDPPRAASPERSALSQEDKERQFWREHLPYKVVTVSKREFQLDQHEECETCDEAVDGSDEGD